MPRPARRNGRRWPAPPSLRPGLADRHRRYARHASRVPGGPWSEADELAEAERIEAGGAVLIKAGRVDRAYWTPGVCLDTTLRLDQDDQLSVVE